MVIGLRELMNLKLSSIVSLAIYLVPSLVQAAPISSSDLKANVARGLRLIELADDAEPVWMTEDQKLDLIRADTPFFDVTETYETSQALAKQRLPADVYTYGALKQPEILSTMLAEVSIPNMQADLSRLTSFNNRYYRSTTGADAARWILSTVQTIAAGRASIRVSAFTHSWGQSSTIARIAGRDNSATAPITVLGAHMDSVNSRNPTSGRSPGADDDGSGSVNLIEAFRVLVANGFQPATPVEFHWYSGEEGGLLGSNAIATQYRSNGWRVKGALQLDMTAYFRPGTTEVAALMTDYTDASLNTFVESLIRQYTRLTPVRDRCGYGCSDHASWNRNGFPSAFPFEAPFSGSNPAIHTDSDTTTATGFSWSHSLEFAKLAVAFATELSSIVALAISLAGVSFAAPISPSELKSNAAQGLRLIELAEGAEPVWMTEDQKLDLIRARTRFFDVTETYEASQNLSKLRLPAESFTYGALKQQVVLSTMLAEVSITNMQNDLSWLTSFNNRYYRASTGADASSWILSTVQAIAAGKSNIRASAFAHSWVQSSTIVRIAGLDNSATAPVTILGAHMDSINGRNPTTGRAPGADDDGSGTVNLLEAFRVLVANGFQPATPVEFHWYSGEEGGLLGSNAIATKYKADGVRVKGALQLDMTAYFRPGSQEVAALMTDFTDASLTTFVEGLVSAYTRLVPVRDRCGYGCSDHASWNRNGFPSAFPFEAPFSGDNPAIHSDADTTAATGFSWSHSLEFAKLAVAFATEMSS
ncbi:hypothetical protein ONZ45_g5938 [Pleurotus djamor]|nr:hypothetical protein ONZ45_g5938 [Pleurotus djamor]